MNTAAPVIVVSGLPGAGKTSTARALARKLPRAAHVEADVLHAMIAAGRVSPDGLGPPAVGSEAEAQLLLRLEQACQLARSFVAQGITAVIDEIVIGGRLAEARGRLAGLDVGFVMLDLPFTVVRERWRTIDSPFVDRWDWIEEERQRTPRIGLWIDTAEMTVEETADTILGRFDEALLR